MGPKIRSDLDKGLKSPLWAKKQSHTTTLKKILTYSPMLPLNPTDLYREPPSEFKPITSSLYMRVFENGSLIIYNTQRTDAGYYLCQAQNGVGPGLSRVIKLTVNGKCSSSFYPESQKRLINGCQHSGSSIV